MAEGKKSFIIYCDLIHVVSKLPNEKAGELFKHILEYVNDLDPQTNDLLLQVLFEPIKLQMKRDLVKWENESIKRSESGRLGGLKSGEARRKQSEANEASALNSKQTQANEAVTVTVSVTDNDTVNDNVTNIDKDKGPNADESATLPKDDIEVRKQKFKESIYPFAEEFTPTTCKAFFEYWSEKNTNGKKMRFEMQKTFELSLRLKTWKEREKNYGATKKTITPSVSFAKDKDYGRL
jgi:hypothetical protein